MHTTFIRRTGNVADSVLKLLPNKLPSALSPPKNGNLYQTLSRTPNSKDFEVHQKRWSESGVADSYWRITNARFKDEGRHGKAWGILYWKG
ncbi:hypothetical protein AN958_07955 [Leucoagaricus sp. SymC.cos]|nr:hypothetical protein AN958_07955 [Leucoagaricus sp. SymC.cos]